MKFKISKEELLSHLQTVTGPTTGKQQAPILSSVLIEAKDGKIKFTTTDLDITIISTYTGGVIEVGSTAIPAKRFFSIIREFPTTEIIIEKKKNNLLITCGEIEFKVNTFNPEEFPQIKEEENISLIKVAAKNIEEMIRLTSFCVGAEDSNYALSGVLFEIFGGEIKLVATDGKRLSFTQKSLSSDQPEIKSKLSFILPAKAVGEIYKITKDKQGEVYLSVKKRKIGVQVDDIQLIARPIEGEFPDYSQYIPGVGKNKMVVNRKKILFGLRRASLLAAPNYQGVSLEVRKDGVVVSKSNPQLGEVKEVIDVQYNGPVFTIGFNPVYLIDILKNLEEDDVGIEFFGPEKPAVIRKEHYIYLLLPVKM